ncbi:NADPH-dependent 2,4-dienoyl-CoA reductase/sulfur reductase-like enzyme [Streptomyces brevispora]|uniref:NADPH-dependent 2,4-dienoyl-CoA reductase/sulfur reductase-like enzyme n=1 Tax=Streptomyces brevispora TaxID=887462 RepID=A0A561V4B1_9ACTN|nr:FAD/NAD(P)-binding oxidoreductase [Streptomyces brevispora]TWG06413.1 NADPH-dependent 2,4-dienoyl-CoA reductase/sulfur reductase-like enzyme [Streptomyces brevispora]
MTVRVSDIVVVGGSVAALRAAETVARQAPHLSLTVVSDEAHVPHERPPLSKVGLEEPFDREALTYPAVARLREQGVTFVLNTRAEGLDVANRQLLTTAGSLEYGALVAATGCEPFVPPVFAGQPDVFTLRRYEDAVGLRAAVLRPGVHVAVVGAGFIGGEFAATLAKAGRRVTVIDLAKQPLGRFGEAVAQEYQALHRAAGVQLRFGAAVTGLGEDGGRRFLLLDDDSRVPADVILVGVGVRPSTAWLEESGVLLDNGIICDATLKAAERVFAAGDAVRWPNPRWGATMRIEHWTNAAEQGRVAGINAVNTISGEGLVACGSVPYFWSDQHGVRIQFAGYRTGTEEIVEDRNTDGLLVVYRTGDLVTGVLAFERRAQFVKLRAMLRNELPWQQARAVLTPGPAPVG